MTTDELTATEQDIFELWQRLNIIKEARSWYGTPFHDNQMLKGVGSDCLGLLVGVYKAVGFFTDAQVPNYSAQWFMHRSEELYLENLALHCGEVVVPKAADIALFKIGHTYSHSGIVVRWPTEMIHCYVKRGVEVVNPSIDPELRRKCATARFFSPWKKGYHYDGHIERKP